MPFSDHDYVCRHFGREIAAHDIQTKRCDVYGSGEGYQERVMLIYDGLHYDALALAGLNLCDSYLAPFPRAPPLTPLTHPFTLPSYTVGCVQVLQCWQMCIPHCCLLSAYYHLSTFNIKLCVNSSSVQAVFYLFW